MDKRLLLSVVSYRLIANCYSWNSLQFTAYVSLQVWFVQWSISRWFWLRTASSELFNSTLNRGYLGQGPSWRRVLGITSDGVGNHTEVKDTWNDFSSTSAAYIPANLQGSSDVLLPPDPGCRLKILLFVVHWRSIAVIPGKNLVHEGLKVVWLRHSLVRHLLSPSILESLPISV